MDFTAVTRPGVVPTPVTQAAYDLAMAVAPSGYRTRTVEMLPKEPQEAPCRLCGSIRPLTKEHIPPRSVGNNGQYRSFSFADWLDRAEGQLHLGRGAPGQGGVWGYTLCKPCNELTGQRYGTEYKAWAGRAANMLTEAASPHEQDRQEAMLHLGFTFGHQDDGGVAPGDFIRQVLSIMCTLSGGWDLASNTPVVRRIVLDRECSPLPERMKVYMAFCWGPRTRLIGPQLRLDGRTGEWAWIMEMSFPPLTLMMVLDSNYEVASHGVDITPMTLVPPMERHIYEVSGPVAAGFTWSPYPWDLRSSAALGYESPVRPPGR